MGLLTSLKQFWTEWDLRVMVLLSLTLQMLLIILGNRRKYSNNVLLRIVLWLAYLVADSVATLTLGTLSSKLVIIHNNCVSWNASIELKAFWAPFLLLHLGGPDTITAYALEDNELWLRHLLGLVLQGSVTIYVLFMAWTGSRLSVFSVLIFITGFIKYGERVWVLRSASNEQRKKTFAVDSSSSHNHNQNLSSDRNEFIIAYKLLKRSKCFFSDDQLSIQAREAIKIDHTNLSLEKAFKVIEIELGWVYDLLFSKAPILYTLPGFGLRFICFLLSCSVLVLFCVFLPHHKQEYSKIDLSITFMLLIVAIVLEIYAALSLLFSDRFAVWLIMHNKTCILHALSCFPSVCKSPRWSKKISQLSVLTFISKPVPCQKMLNLLSIDENIFHISNEDIQFSLKKYVFEYLISKAQLGSALSSITPYSSFEDFVKNVIIYHIETEILYYIDKDYIKEHDYSDVLENCESAIQMSRYMFYLVVVHSSMFVSEGKLTPDVHLIADEAMNVLSLKLDQEQLTGSQHKSYLDTAMDVLLGQPRDLASKEKKLCAELVHRICGQMLPEYVPKHATSWEVLRQACDRVSMKMSPFAYIARTDIQRHEHLKDKWEDIRMQWMEEFLIKAVISSKGMEHAQQLRFGGEFLTHVWFLMLHMGISPKYEYHQDASDYQLREHW